MPGEWHKSRYASSDQRQMPLISHGAACTSMSPVAWPGPGGKGENYFLQQPLNFGQGLAGGLLAPGDAIGDPGKVPGGDTG